MFFSAPGSGPAARNGLFAGTGIHPPGKTTAMPAMDARNMTVRELHATPVYGQNIRLTGRLDRFPGTNRYCFADDTGEINARISKQVLGDPSLFRTSKVVIRGELKRTLSGRHVIRARSIRMLYS